jgi:hypothetical protein
LDKIVDAYLQWRASRPEIGNLDEEINALELQSVPDSPAIKVETKIQSSSRLENGSSGTALAAQTSAISPPIS